MLTGPEKNKLAWRGVELPLPGAAPLAGLGLTESLRTRSRELIPFADRVHATGWRIALGCPRRRTRLRNIMKRLLGQSERSVDRALTVG